MSFPTTKPTPASPGTESALLRERYGNTPRERRKVVISLWMAGVVAAIILVCWVIWGGLADGRGRIDQRVLGYSVTDASTVEVDFELTAPRESTVYCPVQAMNEKFAIVGWKLLEIGPSEDPTRRFTEPVVTSEEAVTGLLGTCWVAA